MTSTDTNANGSSDDTTRAPAAAPSGARGPRVLVVDDDAILLTAIGRILREDASSVSLAHDARQALERLQSEEYDVIVSDIEMPGMNGLELLRAVRARDLNLPVIFVTGAPSVESASRAVEYGAFRYLVKPVDRDDLRAAVAEAHRLRDLARHQRAGGSGSRAALERSFHLAMATLQVAYQPIVLAETRTAIGYEALMRPREPDLSSPPALLEAAEKLGSLHMLGRRIRALVSAQMEATPGSATFFVNLHPADLADPELYRREAPLSRCAGRVVLELTERASLEGIADLDGRLRDLRQLGFRIAVDDLGAGYAGLSYFARVAPEIVKIDMSLVRNVDKDAVRQRVVSSLVSLAASLRMLVVGEGIETVEERDTMVRLGCTHLQGYNLGKPGPAFPDAHWR